MLGLVPVLVLRLEESIHDSKFGAMALVMAMALAIDVVMVKADVAVLAVVNIRYVAESELISEVGKEVKLIRHDSTRFSIYGVAISTSLHLFR